MSDKPSAPPVPPATPPTKGELALQEQVEVLQKQLAGYKAKGILNLLTAALFLIVALGWTAGSLWLIQSIITLFKGFYGQG
jgi:hypothetical protein